MGSKIINIIVGLFFLMIWYVLTMNNSHQDELLFPSLTSVVNVATSNWHNLFLFSAITWYRVVVGLLVGSFLGAIIGILISWSKSIDLILNPIIEMIRPIPPIALTPFFILWFGLGDLGQLLLIGLGCFMVMVVSTVVAIHNVPPVYYRAARSLGANDFTMYKTVIIPAIMPSLLSGMRVGAATGFGLTVAAEYLGAQGGLGYLIRNARVMLKTDTILLAAIILGFQSLATDWLLRKIFGHITRWKP